MSKILEEKIRLKQAEIAVIGLGYVGLPIACSFAKAGYRVVGIDTDQDRVQRVENKKSYISDVGDRQLAELVNKGLLEASVDFTRLEKADVIIICVPTPLKRKYTPDITFIKSAVRTIGKYFKRNTLIVLESTTYPGTTEDLIKPELEKSGRKVGRDFYLSFSPERIDPGNTQYGVTQIPKVVGGVTKRSGELTKLLYEKVIKSIHLVSSAKTAEMTKLLENSFRIINIGWINEVALMSHKMGIDVWEVIEAAKTKPFGFMPFYPGLGVGGHCIPDDPLYLYWKAKHHGFFSKFLKLSSDVNSLMPSYVVERIEEVLKSNKKRMRGSKLLVVGVTYKKDVKDLRKSPPLTLIELLEERKASVDYTDPFIPYLHIGKIQNKESINLTKKNIMNYDCVIIATDHTRLNYPLILKSSKQIFDLKNIYKANKKVFKL